MVFFFAPVGWRRVLVLFFAPEREVELLLRDAAGEDVRVAMLANLPARHSRHRNHTPSGYSPVMTPPDAAPSPWPSSYAVTLAVFVLVDGLWIALVATRLYEAEMPQLVRDQPQWVPAVVFYLLFVAALVHLAVRPGVARRSVRHGATQGAVLGLTAYATYALTNLAVIDGFATAAALADLAWGGVLGASVAALATALLNARARRQVRPRNHRDARN